ncbi:class I SAM-dependent methyltransferase [Niveispirillum irakense]|uniref:class I SAM-dependent methyltransferase n=1 Tax=Niveispirillum irakense TaxID=34011 RepID=UPI000417C4A7|nr:class I SAM-dependent methyltransferase [Niveispirillum irakense]
MRQREEEAAALVQAGRYRAARRLLLADGGSPGTVHGLTLLGQALVGLHEHEAARQHLQAALALDPTDKGARFTLARALNGLGLAHAAVPLLRELAVSDPSPSVWEALASALRRDAQYAEAVALVDQVAGEGNSLTDELRYQRALSLHALGAAAEALAECDRLLAVDPGHAAGWFLSHACALGPEGLDAAETRLRRATACIGANRKYQGFLAAYALLTGRPVPDAGADSPVAAGAAALLPHLAPDCRLFAVSADILRFALSQAVVPGLVLEFGVRRGTSLRHIAAVAGQPVHGFDSFEGLPEGWGNEPAGTFSTGLDLPAMPDNVSLHPGWFDQTLPAFMAAQAGPVRFVNVDCDIYSSTVTVLAGLAPYIGPGTVLVFDEFIGNRTWAEHEFKAFHEFAAAQGLAWRYIAVSPFTGQVALMIEGKGP